MPKRVRNPLDALRAGRLFAVFVQVHKTYEAYAYIAESRRRRAISHATKTAVVKMERKSATGAAKYSASSPVNCGNS